MHSIIRTLALAAVIVAPLSAEAAFITGDVTGGGNFAGAVTSYSAWIQANPLDGEEVNFWTLNGTAGDTVTLVVTSEAIEFGISVYQGLIDAFDLLVPGFDNEGDVDDNNFIAGTVAFGAAGTALFDVLLPATGIYTIAIGGEEFFAEGASFTYALDVDVTPVPVPAGLWLIASAAAALGVTRRRRS